MAPVAQGKWICHRSLLADPELVSHHGERQSRDSSRPNNQTTHVSRHHPRTSKTNSTLSLSCVSYFQEINRIKAKAKLQKWELDQLAKRHDDEQRKKNDGGGVEVARKFMNYIEYGMPIRRLKLTGDFSKMKDSKGGFMVDEDEGRKEESEAILKKRELLQQLKKPFFDPGASYPKHKLTV